MRTAPAYLLLGPDLAQKNAFIKNLMLSEQTGVDVFAAEEHSLDEIVRIAQTNSLFASQNLILIKNAELLPSRQKNELLAHYLENPNPHTILFFISDEISVYPSLEKCFSSSQKYIFWELFETQRKQWILNFCRERKSSIQSDAADLIVETVDGTKSILSDFLERLIYIGEGSIDIQSVETHLSHMRKETVFTLFNALSKMSVQSSFMITHALLKENISALAIVGYLRSQYQKMKIVRESLLSQPHANGYELCQKAGIKGKRNQESALRILRYSEIDELQKDILCLHQTDMALRNTPPSRHGLLLELCMARLNHKTDSLLHSS